MLNTNVAAFCSFADTMMHLESRNIKKMFVKHLSNSSNYSYSWVKLEAHTRILANMCDFTSIMGHINYTQSNTCYILFLPPILFIYLFLVLFYLFKIGLD